MTTATLADRVRAAVERIRPALELDGGGIELAGVDAERGVVDVVLTGACTGCSSLSATVTFGVERALKQMVPGVTAVRASTRDDDHVHAATADDCRTTPA